MTPSDLGWMPYVTSWTQTFPENVPALVKTKLIKLYEACFQKGLTFQRKKCREPVGCVDIQLATSSAMLIQSILFGPESRVKFEAYGEKPDLLERLVEKLFYFSFVWSVGGSCQAQDHERFDDFAKELLETSGAYLGVLSRRRRDSRPRSAQATTAPRYPSTSRAWVPVSIIL